MALQEPNTGQTEGNNINRCSLRNLSLIQHPTGSITVIMMLTARSVQAQEGKEGIGRRKCVPSDIFHAV